MEDCQEWSEYGALFSRVAASPYPAYSRGFCRPGKAKPPPGATTLAKHHLRPARQARGNGAKVIPTCNRDPRQLFRQRFLDQR
ncbi:Uncharacterised protein [Enterobacter cloacae]|nr:Uncharacterised protein [Enterobacter cloacae]